MENKPHENGFPRRSKDQKSTPVNVSTYSTQRRDKEKKMKMRITYSAGQHNKYTESGQILQGSFSLVSKQNAASKY